MNSRSSKEKNRNTAFVVIHGIGEQSPFETLDAFASNITEYFKKQGALPKLRHLIERRRSANGKPWEESYVRIDLARHSPIDVHEFYWAYVTEEEISVPEVWRWVEQTLAATKTFYRENEDLYLKFKERRGSRHFSLGWVAWLLRISTILYPLWMAGKLLLKLSGIFSRATWISSILSWLGQKTRWVIVGYLGDIAIYTTTDEKSKYYRIRQEILEESQALLEEVLNNPQYDRVIVAGHSLGSVIAYDTLNRINIKANLPDGRKLPIAKLSGLVTFGSPLDKIAFFFRHHTPKNEYVRRQILDHLHSFKAKRLDAQKNTEPVSDPLKPKLDAIPWINFYSRKDPVSGHLDFYKINEEDNIALDLPQSWGVAHTGYWTSDKFYEDIVERFIGKLSG